MASVDVSWMPVSGRRPVTVGSSLNRALKARKGGVAAPKRSNLPDRELYSFRYNFKPESIDADRSGSVEARRGQDTTTIRVERPATQAGGSHVWKGNETVAKEWECVLIYDEELDTFTLEKVDTFMNLTYEGRGDASATLLKQSASPPAAPPAAQLSPDDTLEEQLERDLLGLEDAEGEPDDELGEIIFKAPVKKEEEEEEEEEEIYIPPQKNPSPLPQPSPEAINDTARRNTKPLAVPPEPESRSKPKPVSKPKPKTKPKREAETQLDGSDMEEELNFGMPTRPAKRQKPSVDLALPTASSSFTTLPPRPNDTTVPPPLPASAAVPQMAVDSDDDEDWDEVAGVGPAEPPAASTANADEGEEIDLDAFGREMELQLGESDEDILAAAMSPEPDPHRPPPMSLNQYAAGELSPDDDDTSSSDDSDDDP